MRRKKVFVMMGRRMEPSFLFGGNMGSFLRRNGDAMCVCAHGGTYWGTRGAERGADVRYRDDPFHTWRTRGVLGVVMDNVLNLFLSRNHQQRPEPHQRTCTREKVRERERERGERERGSVCVCMCQRRRHGEEEEEHPLDNNTDLAPGLLRTGTKERGGWPTSEWSFPPLAVRPAVGGSSRAREGLLLSRDLSKNQAAGPVGGDGGPAFLRTTQGGGRGEAALLVMTPVCS